MKTKRKILILIIAFLSAEAILLSFKILNYPSLINNVVSKAMDQPVCKDCNVILISLDTLSANHLPCYGYSRNTAPNLCKFGEDNIMFTNAFSNASWTLPSHVSIFTGLYPSQHKIGFGGNLSKYSSFLPEILQKNKYKTYFYMPDESMHFPINSVYNRGIDEIHDASHPRDWLPGLQKLVQNNTHGKKTFLFLHTYWVHEPYILENNDEKYFTRDDDKKLSKIEKWHECNDSFIEYLKKSLKLDLDRQFFSTNKVLSNKYNALYKELLQATKNRTEEKFCDIKGEDGLLETYYRGYYQNIVEIKHPENINHLRNLYDSKIAELDKYLGDIFEFIQTSELKENTVIIITSDHGEEFMEHEGLTHGFNLYDTTVKVPLIIYIPGQKNKKITKVAQSVDLVPTLLNVLKINNPYVVAGANLFAKKTPGIITYAIAQQDSNSGTIRDNEWKLFYQIKDDDKPVGVHLFNYKKDPQEKIDVIFTNSTIVERLLENIPK